MKYYQKCVKFACNYLKNSSASGGLGAPPMDSAGDSRAPDPLWFCPPPIPNLPPPMAGDKIGTVASKIETMRKKTDETKDAVHEE